MHWELTCLLGDAFDMLIEVPVVLKLQLIRQAAKRLQRYHA